MARSGHSFVLHALVAILVCSGFAQAAVSPTGQFIQTRPYIQLSSENPIGPITCSDVDKASGIVPSVGHGLAVWADGRGGDVAIMGFDLFKSCSSEFLISVPENAWQEGNPFTGLHAGLGSRWVVYDSTQVSPPGDLGDIEGSGLPPAPVWLEQGVKRQRSPIMTNVPAPVGQTHLSWVHHTEVASGDFPGYFNNDIYTRTWGAAVDTNITAGQAAPRDRLAGDGRYLVWQELRLDMGTWISSWDLAVYDLATPGPITYLDGPDAGKNQIDPDISGDLVVWTQEEDPAGTEATNIYFQDLTSGVGPLAVTTHGAAAKAAISKATTVGGGEETYFVVWQDHHEDTTQSFFAGGNGEFDFNWDIWCQEIRLDLGTGEWALYEDPFNIPDATAAGRQTNPDIDGLDVVWQSQAPDVEDIYVWGPIPEPCTGLAVLVGSGVLLARRRKRAKQAL